MVQKVIAEELPVTVQEVPLSKALAVNGLRTMPGESYPDPVRMVTVGAAHIGEILAMPDSSAWSSQSIEFCGGTHIKDTAAAGAFVILESQAVSKGVRRIVAATGHLAHSAQIE